MPHNICVKLTTASLFINVKLLHFSGGWGPEPHSDRCSNRSAYIMRSWTKSVEKGVFLKNTLTSKKWVVASATSMSSASGGERVCRQWLKSCDDWSLQRNDWNNIWAAASWPGHFKRAPVVPQTLILQSCGERHRLYSRVHVFWLVCFILGHCGGPHSAGELEDTHGQSFSVHSASSAGLCQGLNRPSLQRM